MTHGSDRSGPWQPTAVQTAMSATAVAQGLGLAGGAEPRRLVMLSDPKRLRVLWPE
jgi:hypothetical protein